MSDVPRDAPCDLAAPQLSVAREKIIEHRLVSDLALLMLRRGTALDVLRSEFDAHGHDLVFEAAGVIRHVQLKASVDGGSRRDVDINVRLRARPSGCVVWMSYDPATLAVTSYRWFGSPPGEPLPDLGTRVTRHSKGDSAGLKAARPALRNVARSMFEPVADLDELADRLFGPPRSFASTLVMAQLRERFGGAWCNAVAAARRGGFDDAIELAHLIDGYRVLEQLCVLDAPGWTERMADRARSGDFSNDIGLLWTQLFLEHRRWRFASPAAPPRTELEWLDELARRVGDAASRLAGIPR
jgi:hypothetical protein